MLTITTVTEEKSTTIQLKGTINDDSDELKTIPVFCNRRRIIRAGRETNSCLRLFVLPQSKSFFQKPCNIHLGHKPTHLKSLFSNVFQVFIMDADTLRTAK